MSTRREPQDQRSGPGSQLDGAPKCIPLTQNSWNLPYHLKRQRTLDGSEAEDTVEPPAKRLFPPRRAQSLQSHGKTGVSTQDGFSEYDDFELDEDFATFSDGLVNSSSLTDATSTFANQFFLGDSNDAAIEEFIAMTPLDHHCQTPPSSVLKAQDRGSRSADEFDPSLQYSSPDKSCTLSVPSHDEPATTEEEVNWENVREHVRKHPKDMSLVASEQDQQRHTLKPQREAKIPPSTALDSPLPKLWMAKSFKDMRLTPYKTFFHIGEMLQAKMDIFKNQPDATFELFARVLYSTRENFIRKQYFQFRDLFREAPPYLSGILQG